MEYDFLVSSDFVGECQWHQSTSVSKYMSVSFNVRIILELVFEESKPKFRFRKQQADTFGFLCDGVDVVEVTHPIECSQRIFVRGKGVKETGTGFELTVTPTETSIESVVDSDSCCEEFFNIVSRFVGSVVCDFESRNERHGTEFRGTIERDNTIQLLFVE